MSKKILLGKVVGTQGDKTVKVCVTRLVPHPFYGKLMRKKKVYLAHNTCRQVSVGQDIQIIESPPISARKHWVVCTKEA